MNYKLHTLSNGLRILVSELPALQSATVTIWVGTGSRSETDKKAGVSHFLEHMVFKGGKIRPTAKEIADTVDAIGGEFNAGTSKEWTNFYIKARSENIDIAFDVLSDMVLNPALRQEDIDREKGVIIEEIGMYEDTPLWKIEDVFENLIYKGHTLGRDIIGSKETVSALNRKDFQVYRDKHYFAKNMVITVSGGVTEKKVMALAKKYFSEVKSGKREKPAKFVVKQKAPQVFISTKKKDQAHFMLGFVSSEMDSKDRFAENILASVLGGGMSSRIFTEIREKRGLAYSARCSRDAYSDIGTIVVYAGVDPKKIEEAIKVSLDQCYGLATGKYPVEESELLKAKEYVKGHLALSLEDTRSVNSFYGVRAVLLDKYETPKDIFEAIDKVTIADILRVAKKYFVREKLNLAIIGPYKDQAKFEKLLNN